MPESNTQEDENPRITRVIDFRIPLPWLIGGVIFIGWGLISMWFSVNQLVRTVDDLQLTVKSGNTSVGTLSSEANLLKFRMDGAEVRLKQLEDTKRSSK